MSEASSNCRFVWCDGDEHDCNTHTAGIRFGSDKNFVDVRASLSDEWESRGDHYNASPLEFYVDFGDISMGGWMTYAGSVEEDTKEMQAAMDEAAEWMRALELGISA